ncbi:MAG: CheR family methyltransferase, partial [Myxococcota bacterium]
ARQGVYSHEETSALPERLRKRHMKKRADGKWEVSPLRKQEVVFRRFNLKNHLPFKKPFDFVFLRNVMIYFDNETRGDIATRIGKMLYPEGLLFIGLSESLPRNLPGLEAIGHSMYRRKR